MIWDILYILGRPGAYLADILDLRRLIQTKSARNRSLTAWILALVLPSITLLRAWLSVHDLVFTLNALAATILATTFLVLIIKWRKK